jgi:type VI secretion system protein ImpJ
MAQVVWFEGMHLAQHTFQLHSRYFEDAIHFALSHLFVKPYGVAGVQCDAEALRNGTVLVLHARGIMPDGLAFDVPQADPPPPPLDIRELFSPTQDSQVVALTIPAYRAGQANVRTDGGSDQPGVRWVAEAREVPDETTGHDKRPVTFARKNFGLALQASGGGEGAVALPIARVRRDGAGHFIYDPEYVPPCLQIGASARLMSLLQRLVEILDAKAGGRGRGESMAANELASFWLSHAIHSALVPLRHHLQAKGTHPERLYLELARLAGALCTFALDSHPRTLPAYDHDRLGECFEALERHIRAHLEIIAPANYVTIALTRSADYLHIGAVTDQRCLGRAQWFLGVRSSLGQPDLIRGVPQLVKVCSQKHILRLVKEGLAGVALQHVPAPPSGIAPRPDTAYFSIACAGPCWDAIRRSADIGVYVPAGIRDADLDLRVLLEA